MTSVPPSSVLSANGKNKVFFFFFFFFYIYIQVAQTFNIIFPLLLQGQTCSLQIAY